MTGPESRTSAYYSAPVHGFLTASAHDVLGSLAAAHTHDLDVDQRQAWEEEIEILSGALPGLDGTIFLEFAVPRLGSRIDAVLVSGPVELAPPPGVNKSDEIIIWDHKYGQLSGDVFAIESVPSDAMAKLVAQGIAYTLPSAVDGTPR